MIRVSNLPISVSQTQLFALFIPFGSIEKIIPSKVLAQESNKNSDIAVSYADIVYEDASDASEAVENMNGFELYGKYLLVSEKKQRNLNSTGNSKNKIIEWRM